VRGQIQASDPFPHKITITNCIYAGCTPESLWTWWLWKTFVLSGIESRSSNPWLVTLLSITAYGVMYPRSRLWYIYIKILQK